MQGLSQTLLVPSTSFYWTNYKIIKGDPINIINDVDSDKNIQDVIEDDEATQPITVADDQEDKTSVKEFTFKVFQTFSKAIQGVCNSDQLFSFG